MLLAQAPTNTGPSVKGLKERHFEMMRRLVAGDLAVDICRDLGMTQSWFSIVSSSPVFQAELIRLRERANENAADVAGRIKRLCPDAMTVLENAIRRKGDMLDINPATRAKLAQDMLDRGNHGKPVAASQATANVRVEIVQFASPAPPVATVVIDQKQAE